MKDTVSPTFLGEEKKEEDIYIYILIVDAINGEIFFLMRLT